MNWKSAIILLAILLSSCQKGNEYEDLILKFYGDVYEDIGYSVAKSGDEFVIGGQFTEISRTGGNYIEVEKSVNNKKLAIIKTDNGGNIVWKKSFGNKLTAFGKKVLVLDDGSIICIGSIDDTVTLRKDIFIVKVASDGTNPVQKIYGGIGNQTGTDILKTTEGFLLLGKTDAERLPQTDSTGNISGKTDILLIRLNNNLDQIGSPVAAGFPGNDLGAAIKNDINGGYIVVGTTDRSEMKREQQALNNILLLKVNTLGNVVKTRIIGGVSDEYAADFEVLSDGYIVPVTVGTEAVNQKGYILKIPADIYATPTYGPDIKFSTDATILSYSLKAISPYKSNSYVIAGQAGTGTSTKMLIFVLDANGNQVDGKEKIFGGSGAQSAYDVISDENDNIIAVGKDTYENNSMISLLKFRF
jgi:hypothetical protein